MTRLLPALGAVVLATLVIAVPTWGAFSFGGSWGTAGTGAGQFRGLDGVAVDPGGSVYVADTGNARVQKFTAEGAFLTQWGSGGQGPGQFGNASDVAVGPDGSVYVADTSNHRIQRFTTDGVFVSQWGTNGSLDGQFNAPLGVAAGPDGSVYVADTGNNRIQRFLADGTFRTSFGSAGGGNGQFSTPRGIAVGPEGTVYVVDAGNSRVQAFTAEGAFTLAWGSSGPGEGQFTANVRGIAAGAGGVYVADPGSASVQRFTAGGGFLERMTSATSGDGQFTAPRRVAVTPGGQIYVAHEDPRVGRYAQVSDPGDPGRLPPPETGETANAAPVRGTVRVKLPGSNRFVNLDKPSQIPIGSVIDVRRGEIALTTTSGSSRFLEGIFRLLQQKARNPVTELRLEGGNFRRSCRRVSDQRAGAARKRVRKLWGNGKGRFRTKGRYATATLRGTVWLTEDHCDGTLIRVREGAVTVRDLVTRKTLVVRAGKRYFARATGAR